MSNQAGIKHATDTHPEKTKRERRRGAAGRAAALRRAPSDSDCSGETASLSADSGDRAVRPAPPPVASGKSRSRRRGSEWEVLEGLKDGQRFEKRPEVFNGYLHKKRKWPLKGWHKRFFVVDGGILVYARSPTDVARGRLHGSVDVGLSVLSAKARRRRIDIDADEFIYHLRAKTPDVFRTWLNVLKTHRLYRQHLLTFGARESVPKIHAPLDDLLPTDTSSRSESSVIISLSSNEDVQYNPMPYVLSPVLTYNVSCHNDPSASGNTSKNSLFNKIENGGSLDTTSLNKYSSLYCTKFLDVPKKDAQKCQTDKPVSSNSEKQIHLNIDACSPDIESTILCDCVISTPVIDHEENNEKITFKNNILKKTSIYDKRDPNYCINRRQKTDLQSTAESPMKRSKKSTNLVKYRNKYDEPPLEYPHSRCMLLDKYKLVKHLKIKKSKAILCDVPLRDTECQTAVETAVKSLQDTMTTSEYDATTERLIMLMFHDTDVDKGSIHKHISLVVKELYDERKATHPVKTLFKSLLEYWLKNTTAESFKGVTQTDKCTDRQSNKYFTKDDYTCRSIVENVTKQTQFHGISDIFNHDNHITAEYVNKKAKKLPVFPTPKVNSFEKDHRVQELEKMLKSTVYIFETMPSKHSKEKDIEITKKLIANLGNSRQPSNNENLNEGSLAEVPKIQDTINHLISETEIPPEIAKGFLNAYLDLLDDSRNITSSSTGDSNGDADNQPICEVQTESIRKKISKNVTTNDHMEGDQITKPSKMVDPGQIYLKDILDHITTIFSKTKNANPVTLLGKINKETSPLEFTQKEELKQDCLDIITDIDAHKNFNTLQNDQPSYLKYKTSQNLKNITNSSKVNETNPKLKMSHKSRYSEFIRSDTNIWLPLANKSHSSEIFKMKATNYPHTNILNSYVNDIDCDIELRPYVSSSDATSKAYGQHDNSMDNFLKIDQNISRRSLKEDDSQSCYILSSLKKSILYSKYVTKKSTTTEAEAENTSSFNITPRAIDEKFIILLLENLTVLSKNVPSIYKDLNNLYLKLKKKHDKSKNVQGLSLLGKIYDDKSKKLNDTKIATNVNTSKQLHISTNTMYISPKTLITIDTASSAFEFIKDVEHTIVQTDITLEIENKSSSKSNLKYILSSISPNLNIETSTDKAISNQNWFRKYCTKECATTIKKYLENDSSEVFRITTQDSLKIMEPAKEIELKSKNNNQIEKLDQELIKEISSLSPSLKVSTQSQTNKTEHGKDFKVYQLFLSPKFGLKRSKTGMELKALPQKSDDLKTIYRCTSYPSFCSGLLSPASPPLRGPQAGFVSGTPGGRLASWIIESGGPLEGASRELGQAQLSVQQLQRLLDALELQQAHHDTDVSLEGASPNVKKDRRKFGLRKKKSNSKCASVELAPPHIDPSSSHMALSALTAPPSPGGGASSVPNSAASLPIACAATRPQSLPGAEALGAAPASLSSLTPDHQLREDFTVLAKDLVASLKSIVATLVCERGRLRAAVEAAEGAGGAGGAGGGGGNTLATLRTNLSSALHQNSELRSRLSRIHDASDLAEISSVANSEPNRKFQQSLSYSSSCVSASEFFDAEEHEDDLKKEILAADEAGVIELDGDSSSEAGSLSSEEGSASSDNSDAPMVSVEQECPEGEALEAAGWRRRTRLPSPRPTPGGPSLWNLLYKNIGKDLSQISMPVTINEPLNMLQRLCEELEYSELLDAAAACGDGAERAALVAAFAVSAYAAAAHRAASKPFNPLLHETYECMRSDRGFRFVAEQVSHHPPISACHAESPRWVFWQEARIKTKFWGKSMEFQPAGHVHVRLLPSGDHYSWNKVTTCVHNLFGGQRWVDQYGDMHIRCHDSDITCKLSFIKASSWSSSRHEVRGAVAVGGVSRLRLAGRWSEGLFAGDPPAARPLWRPGAMPAEHEAYYGFTRFAMELNELEPGMRTALPHTDTRLRPDQRALEEGDVESAEQLKLELEQAQRERRRVQPDHTPVWFRKSNMGGEDTWVFAGEYWRARDHGFPELHVPRLW